jgi:dipeptidyl aminopeptidase/acylaminoacyl peptidase
MHYLGIMNLDAAGRTGEIAYVAEDQHHLPDSWIFNTRSGKARQITHLNRDLERYELGTAHLVEWVATDGSQRRGTLLLPPRYQVGRRLPLVVVVYGGSQGWKYLNHFGLEGEEPAFDYQVLATRGYAIFYPDAPLRIGHNSQDLVDGIMPGIDSLIGQGFVDPNRLAVTGQSFGSVCVLALITRTDRFKAAVVSAVSHPDILADYLQMNPGSSNTGVGYFESGQGRMGGSPWEYRERYLENSPIYDFDRISTPVLIAQGDRDGLLGANATFVALQRLGKRVEYRIYHGEGHVISRRDNVIDFWNRRIQFLDERLGVSRDAHGSVVYEAMNVQQGH